MASTALTAESYTSHISTPFMKSVDVTINEEIAIPVPAGWDAITAVVVNTRTKYGNNDITRSTEFGITLVSDGSAHVTMWEPTAGGNTARQLSSNDVPCRIVLFGEFENRG